jgi:hypothetical protein
VFSNLSGEEWPSKSGWSVARKSLIEPRCCVNFSHSVEDSPRVFCGAKYMSIGHPTLFMNAFRRTLQSGSLSRGLLKEEESAS